MSDSHAHRQTSVRLRGVLAARAIGFGGGVLAQTAPPGFAASPEIYMVIAENEKYRVIEVDWKPGQKDRLHSHPDAAVYDLTNCTMRNEFAGLAPMQGSPTAGSARVQPPIAAHTIENIGAADCRLIMFEPK